MFTDKIKTEVYKFLSKVFIRGMEAQGVHAGTTAQRPVLTTIPIGYEYYDTSLGRPIWKKNNTTWTDIQNLLSELITSPYDLTAAPDGSWIKYNIAGVNTFTGSPNDSLTWNIQQTLGNSHTVATRLATNRATGEVFSQVYVSSAWQPWVPLSSPNASTTQRGIIEQATDAETITGTDTERSVSPANLQAKLNSLILSATATLNFPVIAIGDTATLTATVTGAALLDPVVVSAPASVYNANNSTVDAWVSAANTVTVRIRNNGASSIDPEEGQFKIKVFK